MLRKLFVEGCQTLGSILIVNECLDSIIWIGILGFICRLDFEKAYDPVNWDQIYLLGRFGFDGKQRKQLWFYISTVQLFISVNGSPTGIFWVVCEG